MNKIIPIRIDPLFWVLAFGLGWLYTGQILLTLVWVVVILFSVFFHELGHALTAILFGQKASITLMVFGGVTSREGPPLSKWKEFLIVLNGPLAGLLLAIIAKTLSSLVSGSYPLLLYTLYITYVANVFWTIVNLFPIQPLDGGHLMLIVMEKAFGFKGVKIAYFCSFILAGALALYAFVEQELLLGALFFLFAYESYRGFSSALQMTGEDQNEALKNDLKEAEDTYLAGDVGKSKEKLEGILKRSQTKGFIHLQATQYLAKILNDEGKFEESYQLLAPLQKKLNTERLMLLHSLAFKTHRFSESAKLGALIHQDIANPDTALINAFSHAELGEVEAAVGWLKTAIAEGLENPFMVIRNARFDKIRLSPIFQNFVSSLGGNPSHHDRLH